MEWHSYEAAVGGLCAGQPLQLQDNTNLLKIFFFLFFFCSFVKRNSFFVGSIPKKSHIRDAAVSVKVLHTLVMLISYSRKFLNF